jgi:hypothetical protein
MPNTCLPRSIKAMGVLLAVAAAAPAAPADEILINLEWRPASQTVYVGDAVDVGLYAVVDQNTQLFRALDMVFTWEAEYLGFLGLEDTGELWSSGFPTNGDHGLNESDPPQDGDGYYRAFAAIGAPIEITTDGFLLTTFQFTALAPTPDTLVDILPSGGTPPPLETIVWGGPGANTDVTGRLGDAWVEVLIPEPATLILLALAALTLRRR